MVLQADRVVKGDFDMLDFISQGIAYRNQNSKGFKDWRYQGKG